MITLLAHIIWLLISILFFSNLLITYFFKFVYYISLSVDLLCDSSGLFIDC